MSFYATLQYYFVNHPTISSFHWDPNHSLFSSPLSLLSITFLYLLVLLLLLSNHHYRPPPPPLLRLLRLLSSLHNLFLVLLSLLMSLGCTLSSLHLLSPSSLLCLPPSTDPSGPLFFWAHVFYLSKLYELLDTFLLLLLSNSNRLSFLHVYHHAIVPTMSYLWLSTRQSLFPVALVTNASVHVVMYSYYLSCSLGWRWTPRWKRLVTNVQIAQFAFSFAVSLGFLWLHLTTPTGCSGFSGWTFNAVFNASLLWLFVDFHGRSYGKKKKNKQESGKKDI